jgi:tetratricopeptide (TPR) repeat protein
LDLNYEKRLPIIYTVLGTYSLWVKENYSDALQNLKCAMSISERNNDNTSMWFASFFLGITLSLDCKFEEGLEFFRKTLNLGKKVNNKIMITFAKGLMSTFNYIFYGKIDFAYKMSQEALSIAKNSGDIYLMGMASSSYGISCFYKGYFQEAEKSLSQALSLCKKTSLLGWETWGTGFLGHTFSELGKQKDAIETYNNGILQLENAKLFPFWINLWKLSILRLKALERNQEINLNEVFELYQNIKVKVVKGWAARYVAEILSNIKEYDNISMAEKWIEKALKNDKKNGTMWSLSGDYAVYAKLLIRKGERVRGKKMMNKAIINYQKCFADGWIKKYKEELLYHL